jgi:sugar lactone lactonase YvrE
MKKLSVIYLTVIGLVLAAISTLAGCKGEENAAVVYSTTPAGPKFNYPSGIAAIGISADVTHLYVADTTNHTIRKVVVDTSKDPDTVEVFTVAGKAGTPGEAPDTDGDINIRTSTFRYPRGIITDGMGNLYVADSNNHTIRKIEIATGDVSLLAGEAGTKGNADSTDDTGFTARFNKPFGITYDSVNQKLYVADTYNHAIRSVELISGPTYGKVLTLAGTGQAGADDLTSTLASFNLPIGLVTDGTYVYVSDTGNNKIRSITISDGSVTSVTGATGVAEAAGYNDGLLATAKFNKPAGLALSGGNDLYVADQYNQVIRHIDLGAGTVDTLAAGTPGKFYKIQEQVSDRFKFPQGIATLDGTTLYIADTFGHALRRLVSGNPLEVLEGDPLYAGSADTD